MTPALFDNRGNRKYLIARERLAFVYAASNEREAVSTFCLTLAFTGARISEVLALTVNRIDAADEVIIFRDAQTAETASVSRRTRASHTDPTSHQVWRRQRGTPLAMGTHKRMEGGQSRNA
jgi:integrase